jgi:hypothetical protein
LGDSLSRKFREVGVRSLKKLIIPFLLVVIGAIRGKKSATDDTNGHELICLSAANPYPN